MGKRATVLGAGSRERGAPVVAWGAPGGVASSELGRGGWRGAGLHLPWFPLTRRPRD